MFYDTRVAETIKNPTEDGLVRLITEEIEINDTNIKAKESAINALAQFYVDNNMPGKIKTIATKYISIDNLASLNTSMRFLSLAWLKLLRVWWTILPKCQIQKDFKFN